MIAAACPRLPHGGGSGSGYGGGCGLELRRDLVAAAAAGETRSAAPRRRPSSPVGAVFAAAVAAAAEEAEPAEPSGASVFESRLRPQNSSDGSTADVANPAVDSDFMPPTCQAATFLPPTARAKSSQLPAGGLTLPGGWEQQRPRASTSPCCPSPRLVRFESAIAEKRFAQLSWASMPRKPPPKVATAVTGAPTEGESTPANARSVVEVADAPVAEEVASAVTGTPTEGESTPTNARNVVEAAPQAFLSGDTELLISPTRGWRATTTPEGARYFYNVRTRKSQWETPRGGHAVARVGDRVEVFSNSVQIWCAGYVERISNGMVTVAFQLPGDERDEWHKKDLPAGHENLRGIRGGADVNGSADPAVTTARANASASPAVSATPLQHGNATASAPSIHCFQDTGLPANWTQEEMATYDALFEEARAGPENMPSEGEAQRLASFLSRSGLSQRAQREIWQVANPDLKPSLGREEFRAYCRLVGHCQEFRAYCRLVGHCQAMHVAAGTTATVAATAFATDGGGGGSKHAGSIGAIGEATSVAEARERARLVKSGGGALRVLLRGQCLQSPPERSPEFLRR
eukprot:TRINITY_DN5062_c0_g1_i6.p1 TRINITY_DN5062_c0_g1~~TRINITY_DN5062_c0_g1_i6.p1  ORF type:complete len:618 (-),score=108.29 TRINITY_DN5062_c0_g1_i6:52-1782(-)